jgi:hypothetical protein
MKNIFFLFAALILLSSCKEKITIVTTENADDIEKFAAIELSKYLTQIYPDYAFHISETHNGGKLIFLKADTETPGIKDNAEGYLIKNEGEKAYILSNGKTGLIYGVYGILEKLGCGFYLSGDMLPKQKEVFDFKEWELSNRPLIKDRLVFNWHNFLSGCSSWDLDNWKHYIDQSLKMRYNGIMTHFYANDPSFIFSYNGIEKEAGFMPNTINGRQYGTQQVNDVRRMVAGQIFSDSVFGSQSSKVTDEQRVEKARELMQNVFKYASSKYMNIWFGYDVDYALANPQKIIATLPNHAKIKIRRHTDKYFGMPNSEFYLPIPDSPEGFAYYQSQITQLLEQFPEINNLVLWTRTSGSAFLTLSYNEFPKRWQNEFDELAATNSKFDKNNENITGRFATSKIYRTVRACLDKIGKNKIKLWAGSWRSTWLEQADWFYPEDVGLIPLDYNTDYFSIPQKRQILETISNNRKVLPVVWAHHDDGRYIGSPVEPYKNLYSKLESINTSGVGIIHWTTKPLDFYFKNVEQQIWQSTKNATLEYTATEMSKNLVNAHSIEIMSEYLINWVVDGPKFGRETRTWFIDHLISKEDYKRTIKSCGDRIKLLNSINEPQNRNIKYFRDLENFYIEFFKNQFNFQQALFACKSDSFKEAQKLLKQCNPDEVINMYAEASSVNGITLGEKGVVVEMNLSWLPLIRSLQQTLRQKPTYYNFGKVNFPDLGVGLLKTSYFIDNKNNIWRNFGEAETGGKPFINGKVQNEGADTSLIEICSTGIQSKDSIRIQLLPIGADVSPSKLKNPNYFLPGKYKLNLIFCEHEFSKKGERKFRICVTNKKNGKRLINETIDILDTTAKRNHVVTKTYSIELKEKDNLNLVLIGDKHNGVIISGLVLEPVY